MMSEREKVTGLRCLNIKIMNTDAAKEKVIPGSSTLVLANAMSCSLRNLNILAGLGFSTVELLSQPETMKLQSLK